MKLKDILELEDLEIHEDNHYVLEYGVIDFSDLESAEDFSLGNYEINCYENNYDSSEITYSILRDGETIDSGLSETEIVEFLQILEEKYRDYEKIENKEKSLLEQREEILRKEHEEKIKKEQQRYQNAYETYSSIMKDKEFKEVLRKTLVEKGAADIPTTCLCGKNGCIDADILKTYFTKEIKEFEKEGVYVRFTWGNITFSLYKNRGHSSYAIIKDIVSENYKAEYHSL